MFIKDKRAVITKEVAKEILNTEKKKKKESVCLGLGGFHIISFNPHSRKNNNTVN